LPDSYAHIASANAQTGMELMPNTKGIKDISSNLAFPEALNCSNLKLLGLLIRLRQKLLSPQFSNGLNAIAHT
jgi:hypothetical protein